MADALEKLGNPDAVTISMVVPRAGMSSNFSCKTVGTAEACGSASKAANTLQ